MENDVYRATAAVEEAHWWFRARREILLAVAKAAVPSLRRVLDVGCGTGVNSAWFDQEFDCIGVDKSEHALRIAQNTYPNVTFAKTAIGEPDFADLCTNTDLILLTDVLEHIKDDSKALSEIISSVGSAYVLLTVPADTALWGNHDIVHGHFRRYDMKTFRDLWSSLKVEAILETYFNTRLYWPIRCTRSSLRLVGKSFGASGTDLQMLPAPLNMLFYRLFLGERRVLLKAIKRNMVTTRYRRGASLLSILRVVR